MLRIGKNIRHIFFDLDDTLWDLRKNSYEGMKIALKTHGIILNEESFNRFINTYVNFNKLAWEAYYMNKISKEDLRYKRFEWTLENFGIFNNDLTKKLAETYMEITPKGKNLVEGCLKVLNFFSSKNYNLYIMTNGFPEVQYIKLQSSGIIDYFNNIFISDNIGYRKPDIEMYKYCEIATNAKPEECLMVGDQFETDIKGAENAGWNSVWLNRSENKRYTFSNTIQKLEELILFF